MSETIIIEKDVGYFVTQDGRSYYELDYGSDCYGDVGLFYRDKTQDYLGGGICYICSLDFDEHPGIIYEDDPDLSVYGYTFDDVVAICKGNPDWAKAVLERASGYTVEVLWEGSDDDEDDEDEEEGMAQTTCDLTDLSQILQLDKNEFWGVDFHVRLSDTNYITGDLRCPGRKEDSKPEDGICPKLLTTEYIRFSSKNSTKDFNTANRILMDAGFEPKDFEWKTVSIRDFDKPTTAWFDCFRQLKGIYAFTECSFNKDIDSDIQLFTRLEVRYEPWVDEYTVSITREYNGSWYPVVGKAIELFGKYDKVNMFLYKVDNDQEAFNDVYCG